MAGRPPKYTDEDKASIFVALSANDGNVKRTARETGLPVSTVRRWRDEWESGEEPSLEAVEVAVGDFLEQAVTTRDLALQVLKEKVPDAKPGELVNIIGMLDDKITRAKGLADRRVEHVHSLPSAEEIREALSGFAAGMHDAAIQRQADVTDAELREQPRGLPAPR